MNKVEEIKKRKDGLDVIHDILRYAQTGFDSIQPEDVDLFKWYGVYQQRPKEGHFMMRLKVPNGELLASQLREIARIANDFGRRLVDITTRQNYQFHWIQIQDVPEIFQRLAGVGMTTIGACGDVTRNIVGCPVAGIDAEEYVDASPLAKMLSTYLTGNKEFSNLPRKFKVSVSGCRIHCAQPDINDVGVFGAERIIEGKREAGFGLKVGGGLSTRPYFAADLGVFLRYDQVFPTVREIAAIFRDSEVLRQDRSRARLKFLLHDPKIGIGPERFRKLLEERLGYRLDDVGAQAIPEHTEVDHLGIRAQKQPGKFYLGIGVPAGRLSGDALFRLADIADEFSTDATVRNTNKQNFLITSIPGERLEFLKAKVRAAGFDFEPSVFRRAIVSCTGIEFCNLAVTETKEVARNAANDLEKRFPGAQKNVRIHFSGCPNNCGQNSIADIGLRGGLTKIAGKPVEVFDILLGGTTGAKRAFAETTSRKIPGAHVTDAIANLYEAFLAWSKNGGIFHDFVKSHTAEELDGIARKGLPAPPPTGIQPPLGP